MTQDTQWMREALKRVIDDENSRIDLYSGEAADIILTALEANGLTIVPVDNHSALIERLRKLAQDFGLMYDDLDVIEGVTAALSAAPAAQAPSPMDHWKRARVDPPAVAGLVEAARAVEPHLDAIVCYASTMDEHEPNRIAYNLRAALAAYDKEPS